MQSLEALIHPLETGFHLPAQRREFGSRFHPQRTKVSFDPVKPLVHLLKPLVDLLKSLVDLFKPLVNLFKPLVNLVEALINLVEPLVDPPVEVIEALVGPALPHQLHHATVSDKTLRV